MGGATRDRHRSNARGTRPAERPHSSRRARGLYRAYFCLIFCLGARSTAESTEGNASPEAGQKVRNGGFWFPCHTGPPTRPRLFPSASSRPPLRPFATLRSRSHLPGSLRRTLRFRPQSHPSCSHSTTAQIPSSPPFSSRTARTPLNLASAFLPSPTHRPPTSPSPLSLPRLTLHTRTSPRPHPNLPSSLQMLLHHSSSLIDRRGTRTFLPSPPLRRDPTPVVVPRPSQGAPPRRRSSAAKSNTPDEAETDEDVGDSSSGSKKRKRRRRADEEPRDFHMRKFACETCGKLFARPSGRDIHLLSHSKETPLLAPNHFAARHSRSRATCDAIAGPGITGLRLGTWAQQEGIHRRPRRRLISLASVPRPVATSLHLAPSPTCFHPVSTLSLSAVQ